MKVLIANRGEIAARIARTCRELGTPCVAVYSDPDRGEPHTRAANVAVSIGGATPAESYLDADKLIDAARRTGCTHVHPGFGFLSENADFAEAVLGAGLTWVGPSPDAIRAMGSKTEARARMIAAGVPVVPGGDDPDTVGYPLLIKASAGGGGRGMRLVRSPQEFDEALASARSEAGSAFGDDTVFLERFIENGRHIEVQVVGDAHGKVIALHERECSIQRRHQKVVEEAPSWIVTPELRKRLCDAAVSAAEAVDYVGAGTVEFLVSGEDIFFLEMNTRLQVEHGVTEAITGMDLVAKQLDISNGGHAGPVWSITGHAIEVRIYAEDPASDYLPQSGPVLDWHLPELAGVRVDSGVETGSVVGVNYDPMLAKIITHGSTRRVARRLMRSALRQLSVLGLKTNRAQLAAIIAHEDFVEADLHTGWLEAQFLAVPVVSGEVLAVAHRLATTPRRLPQVPLGWRNSRFRPGAIVLDGRPVSWLDRGAHYEIDGRKVCDVTVDGPAISCEIDGVLTHGRVVRNGAEIWVRTAEGEVCLVEDERFPDPADQVPEGALVAPMASTVLRVEVEVGQTVQAGELLLVLEAMKMEQAIRAPAAGVVTALPVSIGQVVEGGAVLAAVESEA
ncbi:MAG: ATP-grasp domain-containing protein [Proteobacteria bacterium]|nr:ATP-grasp domain-containing protein [Pseudomonadota bacterium]MCP4920954.1 ATP-grasp domain-containing protein [Pseudomonadota bacterium]